MKLEEVDILECESLAVCDAYDGEINVFGQPIQKAPQSAQFVCVCVLNQGFFMVSGIKWHQCILGHRPGCNLMWLYSSLGTDSACATEHYALKWNFTLDCRPSSALSLAATIVHAL